MATAVLSPLAFALTIGFAGCAAELDPDVGSSSAAVTAAQCSFFEADGKVPLCHHTSSAKHPYVFLDVSMDACLEGHSGHDLDYISSNDPSCAGLGCFPVDAPCDDLVPCCDGLECGDAGVCANIDACLDFPCPEGEQCQDLPPPAPGSGDGRECTPL